MELEKTILLDYEEPILIDLEDLESVSGGGCNTGGSASGINACAELKAPA